MSHLKSDSFILCSVQETEMIRLSPESFVILSRDVTAILDTEII